MKNLPFLRTRVDNALDFFKPNGQFPQASFLRVEQLLVDGQGNYTFDISKGSGQGRTERKLERNDLFLVDAIAVFLKLSDPATPGEDKLIFDPEVFASLTGQTLSAKGLPLTGHKAIHQGSLSLKVGSTVNLEALPLLPFKNSNPVAISAFNATTDKVVVAESFNFEDKLVYLPEAISLAGTKTNEIKIEFPTVSATDLQTGSAPFYSLVLYFSGHLVKNGATITKNARGVESPYVSID
jgi:hypothetical protein